MNKNTYKRIFKRIYNQPNNNSRYLYRFQCPIHADVTCTSQDHIILGDRYTPGPFFCEKCDKYYANYYKYAEEGKVLATYKNKPLVVTKQQIEAIPLKSIFKDTVLEETENRPKKNKQKTTPEKKHHNKTPKGKHPYYSSNWGRAPRPRQPWMW